MNILVKYIENVEDILNQAKVLLGSLQPTEGVQPTFDEASIEKILRTKFDYEADINFYVLQYDKFRNDNPQVEDLELMAQLEKNIQQINLTLEQVLVLCEQYKPRTLSGIISELGLRDKLKSIACRYF